MDDPDCDIDLLYATYEQFHTINRLIGGWRRIYKSHIRPALLKFPREASILDIGCGGGDILRLLYKFCQEDELKVQFTGIEPDVRAIVYTQKKHWPGSFTFLNSFSNDLVQQKQSYTVVISNHLIHHLTHDELRNICDDAQHLAQEKVIFSDIERSDVGYACFKTFAPLLFKNSFIVADGIRSIRRSYQKDELEPLLPDGWTVHKQFPFRLLAICDGGHS